MGPQSIVLERQQCQIIGGPAQTSHLPKLSRSFRGFLFAPVESSNRVAVVGGWSSSSAAVCRRRWKMIGRATPERRMSCSAYAAFRDPPPDCSSRSSRYH
ncbi:hypothetical protein Q1695_014141 [Nippostrongylus brasiliensis]|nr:hypothetical protein Q1695_014141 [Nippostrongylus brasiliensis]